MIKPVVTCDIDGVLSGWARLFCLRASLVLGREINYDAETNYIQPFGLEYEEVVKLQDDTRINHDLVHIPPEPGAVEAVTVLCEHYQIVPLTGRPDPQHDQTIEWLRLNFPPELSQNLRYGTGANSPFAGVEGRETKEEVAEKLGAVYHIEDNPFEVVGWRGSRVAVICFAQPYNRKVRRSNPNIPRLRWRGIVELLLSRESDNEGA